MKEVQNYEVVGDHAEYRPTGDLSLSEAIRLITRGIEYAHQTQVKKLLVDTLGLTGFRPPNVVQRYYFVHEWAKASGYSVCVAVVAHPVMIDPQKFGVTVAANIGFKSDVFTSEVEAQTWLLSGG